MELFSVMAKGNHYFLSLHDKSKQTYKAKINNIQKYHPYQIKKEELSGDISKFPPLQWHFLLLLSPLTKEELKAYESLVFYNQFTSGWVKEVKIKQFLNFISKLPWLLDVSIRKIFPYPFYCSILIRCIVLIASAKFLEHEGSILSSTFYG